MNKLKGLQVFEVSGSKVLFGRQTFVEAPFEPVAKPTNQRKEKKGYAVD